MKNLFSNIVAFLLFVMLLAIGAQAQWNESCNFGNVTSVPTNYTCEGAYNAWSFTVTGGGTKTSGPFTITAPASVRSGQPFVVTIAFNPSTSGNYVGSAQFTYNSSFMLSVNAYENYLAQSVFDPLYKVTSILYSPPGNQSSQGFGTSTTHGTTTTVGNSFSFSEELTFSSGVKDVITGSASTGFTTTSSNTSAFTQTWTDATTLTTDDNSNSTWNPTASDAINHNLDSFIIWLNPTVTVFSSGSTPVSYTTNSFSTAGVSALVADMTPAVPAITMEPLPGSISQTNPSGISSVPVAWLMPQAIASSNGSGNSYMPGLGAICKNNTLYQQQLANPTATICTQANQCGCAPSDFAAILQTDPLLNYNGTTYTANPYSGTISPLTIDTSGASVCGENPVPTSGRCRYEIVPISTGSTTTQFETLSGSDAVAYSQTDSTSDTETIGESLAYNVGISFSVGPLIASLKVMDTWTWTDSESTGTTNGSSATMSVTLKTSHANCEENVNIYEDTVYHTYAFQVPTGIISCP
jgi:hypothetical protein